ncbi:MAG: hypothetical protein U0U09_15910 [Cyclobacteriaceae bacterium]
MKTILISSKDSSSIKLLTDLAKKLGVKAKSLNKQEIEDWLIAKKIEAGLKTEAVSKDIVLKALQK